MEDLTKFLNSMTQDQQKQFAIRCKTTIGYLRKAMYKNQEIGPEISVSIEIESNGEVTRKMLHPNSFLNKWPELAQQDQTNSKDAA